MYQSYCGQKIIMFVYFGPDKPLFKFNHQGLRQLLLYIECLS